MAPNDKNVKNDENVKNDVYAADLKITTTTTTTTKRLNDKFARLLFVCSAYNYLTQTIDRQNGADKTD